MNTRTIQPGPTTTSLLQRVRSDSAYGAFVLLYIGYVVLPLLGVYKPIWEYDLETLGKDLSAHLVFGTATAAAFRLLSHGAADT